MELFLRFLGPDRRSSINESFDSDAGAVAGVPASDSPHNTFLYSGAGCFAS